MRYWDERDANGNPLTDGRICLVIKSDEDPGMPEIRTYGKDKEEVLDKVAKTAETAQAQIHRLKKQPLLPVVTAARPSGEATVAAAVADLSNPQKAPGAVRTLLQAAGVDVERQARTDAARKIADLAEQWERQHPEYPKDPRNDQSLMNKAALLAGGVLRITAEHLDAALEELQRREMFFEVKAVQPRGSEAPSTVRAATSYRRNSLRSTSEAIPARKESEKEARWRHILENGTGKALDDALRNEPDFQEWSNKQLTKTA